MPVKAFIDAFYPALTKGPDFMLKDEIAKNKEMMKEKNKWERFKYFFYYHWKPIVLIIIAVCCIISFINHVIESSKESSIYVAIVNCNIMSEEQTDLVSGYALSRNIDTDTNPARLDVSLQMSETRNDNLDVANNQKLSAFLESGNIDVLLAPEWTMESCATQAYLANIETTLPSDLYEKLQDRLIYYTYEDDGKVPIAIYVGDIPKVRKLYEDDVEPYFAMGNMTERKEAAVDFLNYLLED